MSQEHLQKQHSDFFTLPKTPSAPDDPQREPTSILQFLAFYLCTITQQLLPFSPAGTFFNHRPTGVFQWPWWTPLHVKTIWLNQQQHLQSSLGQGEGGLGDKSLFQPHFLVFCDAYAITLCSIYAFLSWPKGSCFSTSWSIKKRYMDRWYQVQISKLWTAIIGFLASFQSWWEALCLCPWMNPGGLGGKSWSVDMPEYLSGKPQPRLQYVSVPLPQSVGSHTM